MGSFPRVWVWLTRIWEVSRVARDGCRLQVGLPDPVATESEVPRSAPAAGKASLGRPRATEDVGGGHAIPVGLRRGWIRIWHRRLCGPVFVGSRRSGSSLQPRPTAVGAVARAAPGSHPDPAAQGQGTVPSVGGLHGRH